jgi:OOP family OmpA-OmpF porin
MKLSYIAAVSLACFAAQSASAQSPYLSHPSEQVKRTYNDNFPNWYLGTHAQMSYISDAGVETSIAAGADEIEFDEGYALGFSIGYRPSTRLDVLKDMRFELEYSYRDAAPSTLTASTGNRGLDGYFLSHNIMFNTYYDFKNTSQWTPYVGGGLGIAFVTLNENTLNIDDSDEALAYQGMLGVSYAPTALPDTEWGIGYRYVGMTDPKLQDTAGNSFEHEYHSHNVELQARFRF